MLDIQAFTYEIYLQLDYSCCDTSIFMSYIVFPAQLFDINFVSKQCTVFFAAIYAIFNLLKQKFEFRMYALFN